jgi:fucokinase
MNTKPCIGAGDELCIITARDRGQARRFEEQVRYLAAVGALPSDTRFVVLPDPPGTPLGTGGATLQALCAALDLLPADGTAAPELLLAGRRVFIIHCGGLSQRMPQFAQLGKVFAPLPGEGWAPNPLLREVLGSLRSVSRGAPDGVWVACGDALFTCNPANVSVRGVDAAVIVCPAPPEQAARHGVYGWDRATGVAERVYQKPTTEEQHAANLVEHGRAWLDTGVVYLSPAVASAWARMVDGSRAAWVDRFLKQRARWEGVEFYQDVTGSLIPGATTRLGRPLGAFQLKVLAPKDGRFLHFGTTPELIAILCAQGAGTGAWVHPDARVHESARVQASILSSGESTLGPLSLVQYTHSGARMELEGNNHVLGVRGEVALRLPRETLLYQAPVKDAGEALVLLGVGDNPKQAEGEARFLGGDLNDWAAERGLDPAALWPHVEKSERTLWNARLYPTGREELVFDALPWLLERSKGAGEKWASLPRLSMEEVRSGFDVRRWRRYERGLHARLLAGALTEAVDDGRDAAPLLSLASAPGVGQDVAQRLRAIALRERRPLVAARLWQTCAELARPADSHGPVVEAEGAAARDQQRAFQSIKSAVHVYDGDRGRITPWSLPVGSRVDAAAPVRLDLAGGWTDTPPQALEIGGSVINVALTLNGGLPIRASVELIAEPVIHLVATDLGMEATFEDARALKQYADPSDPFCLHKASIFEAGALPERVQGLARALLQRGAGLRITTDSGVPKGSGLGTSSILGAAVLAALRQVAGHSLDVGDISNRVLRLEQRLTTGGGWQDQVGALLGGFKLARSRPGTDQTPEMQQIPVPAEVLAEFEARLVICYTGVPRLARNVLQRVVARYLKREPAVVDALAEMKVMVEGLHTALLEGEFRTIGAIMQRSWELNKQIEPSASNEDLEALFARIAPFADGAKMAGAGGGGFVAALAKDREAAAKLRQELGRQGEEEVYPSTVSREGLGVSVLACASS